MAKREILPGEVIFGENPLIYGPYPSIGCQGMILFLWCTIFSHLFATLLRAFRLFKRLEEDMVVTFISEIDILVALINAVLQHSHWFGTSVVFVHHP